VRPLLVKLFRARLVLVVPPTIIIRPFTNRFPPLQTLIGAIAKSALAPRVRPLLVKLFRARLLLVVPLPPTCCRRTNRLPPLLTLSGAIA